MHRAFFVLVGLLAVPAWARVEPLHFAGALAGETREKLQAELERLDAAKPKLGGSIALTSVGAGVVLFGLGFLLGAGGTFIYTGTVAGYAVVGYVLLVCAAVFVVAGGILLTVGLVKLFGRIAERRPFQQQMDEIQLKLEALDTPAAPDAAPAPAPAPDETPSAPAQPGAGFFDVQPTHVLARF